MIRPFFAAAWNEVRIEFSERSAILFFAILPLLFTAVVGIGLRSMGSDPDPSRDNRLALAVIDEDQSELSRLFITTLDQSSTVVPILLTTDEARAAWQAEEISAILTLPAGFDSRIAQNTELTLPLEAHGGMHATIIEETIRAAGVRITGAVLAADRSLEQASTLAAFESESAEQEYLAGFYDTFDEMFETPPLAIVIESAGVQEATLVPSGFNQSSPGQLVTWTMITFLGTSIVFVVERRMGTLRRLLTMPVPRAVLLGGKVFGRLLLGLIQMAILILSGVLLFNVSWGGSPGAIILISVSFGLAMTSLGLFLATIVKTPRQADSVSVITSMALAALGGAWWPLEITGKTYQAAVQVLPSTWAMRGYNDIILRGQDISGILLECGVLLGCALLFFLLSWRRFRFE